MLVRTIESFLGPNGERVERLKLINAETEKEAQPSEFNSTEDPKLAFLGVVGLPVTVENPNGQLQILCHQDVRFPIEASTLQESFEKFEPSLNNYLNWLRQAKQRKQAEEENKIVIPNAAEADAINKSKIIVP